MTQATKHNTLKLKHILIGICGILLLSLYFFWNPTEVSFFPSCPFYGITGLHCPGCGSQRALHELLHFNIIGAIGHNILWVIGFGIVGYNLVLPQINSIFKKSYYNYIHHPKTPIYLFIIILLFWILRNIDRYPFTLLAP